MSLDASFVFGGPHEIGGEVANDRHVLRAMAFSQARLNLLEYDVELTTEPVLDAPNDRGWRRRPVWRAEEILVARLEAAALLQFRRANSA